MNRTKKVGKYTAKAALWGCGAWFTFSAGSFVKNMGEELCKKPDNPLVVLGIMLSVAGEAIQTATVIPGLASAWNVFDAGIALIEKNEGTEG